MEAALFRGEGKNRGLPQGGGSASRSQFGKSSQVQRKAQTDGAHAVPGVAVLQTAETSACGFASCLALASGTFAKPNCSPVARESAARRSCEKVGNGKEGATH